jgi:hypothetical protein
MKLGIIRVSEVSHTKKNKQDVLSHIQNLNLKEQKINE